MSEEFDASQVWDEPVSADVVAAHDRTMTHLTQMPNAMANARLHAANELQRIINVCNRLAWRARSGRSGGWCSICRVTGWA